MPKKTTSGCKKSRKKILTVAEFNKKLEDKYRRQALHRRKTVKSEYHYEFDPKTEKKLAPKKRKCQNSYFYNKCYTKFFSSFSFFASLAAKQRGCCKRSGKNKFYHRRSSKKKLLKYRRRVSKLRPRNSLTLRRLQIKSQLPRNIAVSQNTIANRPLLLLISPKKSKQKNQQRLVNQNSCNSNKRRKFLSHRLLFSGNKYLNSTTTKDAMDETSSFLSSEDLRSQLEMKMDIEIEATKISKFCENLRTLRVFESKSKSELLVAANSDELLVDKDESSTKKKKSSSFDNSLFTYFKEPLVVSDDLIDLRKETTLGNPCPTPTKLEGTFPFEFPASKNQVFYFDSNITETNLETIEKEERPHVEVVEVLSCCSRSCSRKSHLGEVEAENKVDTIEIKKELLVVGTDQSKSSIYEASKDEVTIEKDAQTSISDSKPIFNNSENKSKCNLDGSLQETSLKSNETLGQDQHDSIRSRSQLLKENSETSIQKSLNSSQKQIISNINPSTLLIKEASTTSLTVKGVNLESLNESKSLVSFEKKSNSSLKDQAQCSSTKLTNNEQKTVSSQSPLLKDASNKSIIIADNSENLKESETSLQKSENKLTSKVEENPAKNSATILETVQTSDSSHNQLIKEGSKSSLKKEESLKSLEYISKSNLEENITQISAQILEVEQASKKSQSQLLKEGSKGSLKKEETLQSLENRSNANIDDDNITQTQSFVQLLGKEQAIDLDSKDSLNESKNSFSNSLKSSEKKSKSNLKESLSQSSAKPLEKEESEESQEKSLKEFKKSLTNSENKSKSNLKESLSQSSAKPLEKEESEEPRENSLKESKKSLTNSENKSKSSVEDNQKQSSARLLTDKEHGESKSNLKESKKSLTSSENKSKANLEGNQTPSSVQLQEKEQTSENSKLLKGESKGSLKELKNSLTGSENKLKSNLNGSLTQNPLEKEELEEKPETLKEKKKSLTSLEKQKEKNSKDQTQSFPSKKEINCSNNSLKASTKAATLDNNSKSNISIPILETENQTEKVSQLLKEDNKSQLIDKSKQKLEEQGRSVQNKNEIDSGDSESSKYELKSEMTGSLKSGSENRIESRNLSGNKTSDANATAPETSGVYGDNDSQKRTKSKAKISPKTEIETQKVIFENSSDSSSSTTVKKTPIKLSSQILLSDQNRTELSQAQAIVQLNSSCEHLKVEKKSNETLSKSKLLIDHIDLEEEKILEINTAQKLDDEKPKLQKQNNLDVVEETNNCENRMLTSNSEKSWFQKPKKFLNIFDRLKFNSQPAFALSESIQKNNKISPSNEPECKEFKNEPESQDKKSSQSSASKIRRHSMSSTALLVENDQNEQTDEVIELKKESVNETKKPTLVLAVSNLQSEFPNIQHTSSSTRLLGKKVEKKSKTMKKFYSDSNLFKIVKNENLWVSNKLTSTNLKVNNNYVNLDGDEWVNSGKTKMGIRFDRLMRRYKKLSYQKRYLIFFIIVLLFFTTISFLIVVIILLSGPKFQHIYINTPNSVIPNANYSAANASKIITVITSTTSTTTTTPKILGIVGDACLKVIGDCSRFMECRQQDASLAFNVSTCQCINGYVADKNRQCRGLSLSSCENDTDCSRQMLCSLEHKKCVCKDGYHSKPDGTCFAKYNSECLNDKDCLKNGECRKVTVAVNASSTSLYTKRCECSSKERTVFKPDEEPYRQCRLLIGAKCEENQDCIENARCNKYCSCREIDLFFETENFLCEDACQNKSSANLTTNGQPTKFAHPRKCGYYYTCLPRDLDVCPSNYTFDSRTQSCNSNILCRK